MKAIFLFVLGASLFFSSCVPIGVGPTPRTLRKNPEIAKKDYRQVFPDSLLPQQKLIEFPYRQVEEIRLSWKVVAGLKLSSQEIRKWRGMILKNVENYWLYRHPNRSIPRLALENLSVKDAQILLSEGYPLLLYSAYDIKHRARSFTFEGFDICVGYQGLTGKKDKRVSFKLNSGLRGYIDSEAMLTGTLLDIPKLKNSKVQVLQVILLIPPEKNLEHVYQILRNKYQELGVWTYSLPVLEEAESIGSIR